MLEVDRLTKTFGTGERAVRAIDDLTFEVAPRDFVCIVGPSGCGKTTLLRCIAGLDSPTTGMARLHGNAITSPPRGLGFVFQDYSRSLLPWLTVWKNVMLPLRNQRLSKFEKGRLVQEALEAVGLADAMHRYPWQLSGGMQQRVAIARAIAYQPDILLMDEPFASVDAQTRSDLEDLLLGIWSDLDITIVFVTHDIDESIYLADRVIALTSPPTTVRKELTVDLPRPRDQLATKALPHYTHLRSDVLRLVRR